MSVWRVICSNSRDWKNRTARFAERHIEDAILGFVNEEIGLRQEEPASYQDFLSPDERAGSSEGFSRNGCPAGIL
jgi:hypothetical protein